MREVTLLKISQIKNIIREYCEQCYTINLTTQTTQRLEKHKLPKFTKDEIDNLNSPISSK